MGRVRSVRGDRSSPRTEGNAPVVDRRVGGIDPDTGRSERGLFAYRAYFDEDATPIGVPTQLVGTPHYWIGTLH